MFTTQFTHWYDLFASHGKPMIVTETAATDDQVDFLQGIADALPRDFPQIKALVYFDSIVSDDWRLESYGAWVSPISPRWAETRTSLPCREP